MSLNLKLVKGQEIRKAHLLPQNIPELYACIDSIFQSTDFKITYVDTEGDNVTVATQKDLEDAYSCTLMENKPFLKLYLEKIELSAEDFIKQSSLQVESEDSEAEEVVELESKPVESEPVALDLQVDEDKACEAPVATEESPKEPEDVATEAVPATEAEAPKAEEENFNRRGGCGIRKAMWQAAKHFKKAFKPICKDFPGFQGCKPRMFRPFGHGPLFTPDQVSFIREVIREELGQTQPVHSNFTCDGCGVHPIVGVRYNCTVCRNFDFCETCEAKTEHAHPFIKHKAVTAPRHKPAAPVSNEVVVDLDLGNVLPFVPEQLKEIVSKMQRKVHNMFAPKVKGLNGKPVVHLSLEKNSEVAPESEYVKTWVFVNNGKVAWPKGTKLVQERGKLRTITEAEVPELAPGETVEISVVVKTPARLGKVKGFWRFQTPEGQNFGRARCIVKVANAEAMPDLVPAEEASTLAEIEIPTLVSVQTEVAEVPTEVVQLMNMGFTEEAARIALHEAQNDVNIAVSLLFRQ